MRLAVGFLRAAQTRRPASPASLNDPRSFPALPNSRFTIHVDRSSGGGGPRTTISGGPMRSPGGAGPGSVPRMSEYAIAIYSRIQRLTSLRRFVSQYGAQPGAQGAAGGTIGGDLMLRYLLTMLGDARGRGGGGLDFPDGMQPGGEAGRWGDYVFSQDGELSSRLPITSRSSRSLSTGSDHIPNHGEFIITSCACHGGYCGETTARGTRGGV